MRRIGVLVFAAAAGLAACFVEQPPEDQSSRTSPSIIADAGSGGSDAPHDAFHGSDGSSGSGSDAGCGESGCGSGSDAGSGAHDAGCGESGCGSGSDAGSGSAGSDAGSGSGGSDAGSGSAGSDAGSGSAGSDAGSGSAGSDAGVPDASPDARLWETCDCPDAGDPLHPGSSDNSSQTSFYACATAGGAAGSLPIAFALLLSLRRRKRR